MLSGIYYLDSKMTLNIKHTWSYIVPMQPKELKSQRSDLKISYGIQSAPPNSSFVPMTACNRFHQWNLQRNKSGILEG